MEEIIFKCNLCGRDDFTTQCRLSAHKLDKNGCVSKLTEEPVLELMQKPKQLMPFCQQTQSSNPKNVFLEMPIP